MQLTSPQHEQRSQGTLASDDEGRRDIPRQSQKSGMGQPKPPSEHGHLEASVKPSAKQLSRPVKLFTLHLLSRLHETTGAPDLTWQWDPLRQPEVPLPVPKAGQSFSVPKAQSHGG